MVRNLISVEIVLYIYYIVITIVAQNENQPGTVCSLSTVQFTDM